MGAFSMAYRDGPVGIGGWLAFFLTTLGVFAPIRIALSAYELFADPRIARAYGENWNAIVAAEAVIIALNLAALAFIVWRFFARRNWDTVRIGIAGIWLIPFGVTIVETIAVSAIAGISATELLGQTTPDLVRALVYSAVWTAYLLRSVRVANTYPRTPEDDVLAEVFE